MGEFIGQMVKEIREISGIDTAEAIRIGLLPPTEARKWLVKQKYFILAAGSGRTYTDIKYELSEEYGMSVSSIEKLVYGRTK
ncbi:MAG: hypothetical protein KGZ82_08635 [Bacteroidales bacterium]|nr:hypothetical protein [Bacteroidales bacterium]